MDGNAVNLYMGACNKKRKVNPFWEESHVLHNKSLNREIEELRQIQQECTVQVQIKQVVTQNLDAVIAEKSRALDEANQQKNEIEELTALQKQYNKIKLLLEKRDFGKTKRAKNPTTMGMINGVTGTIKTTRYNRCSETLALLQYVRGGESGALIGAWDFLTANITRDKLEDLFASYKWGRFIGN